MNLDKKSFINKASTKVNLFFMKRSLVVSDLRSETKGFLRVESGCYLCAEVSSLL